MLSQGRSPLIRRLVLALVGTLAAALAGVGTTACTAPSSGTDEPVEEVRRMANSATTASATWTSTGWTRTPGWPTSSGESG